MHNTRLSSILIDAHHRSLEGSQRFEQSSLYLTYAKRAPSDVIHAVQGVLRAQWPSKKYVLLLAIPDDTLGDLLSYHIYSCARDFMINILYKKEGI